MSEETPSLHRIFLACPIPFDAAQSLADWAKKAFDGQPVRVLAPEDMHVTLLFWPAVSDELRAELSELTSKVNWTPLPVRIDAIKPMGRNAIALRFRSSRPALSTQFKKERDTLGRMASTQTADPSHRFQVPLRLHVTVARSKGRLEGLDLVEHPEMGFSLDKVQLYESKTGPDSATYTVISPVELSS